MNNVITSSVISRQIIRRQHLEADLQHAVMQYLAVALPSDAVAHHSPGEGLRSLRAQRDLKRSGYQKGWPDIEIIWRGKALFIELKAARGSLSTAQKMLHRKLVYCGAEVMLCRSVEDCERSLRECGVHLKGTVAA